MRAQQRERGLGQPCEQELQLRVRAHAQQHLLWHPVLRLGRRELQKETLAECDDAQQHELRHA
eukprot:15481151-Alexandrium_andersonii.AAC.1